MDDLSLAIKLNGVWAKNPIRDLGEFRIVGDVVARPAVFVDGVALVANLKNDTLPYVLLFFECEPDAFYFFRPNEDTELQIKGS